MEKYKLTGETIEHKGLILYRIEALKNFNSVRKGDKGGFVESEENLSQDSNCWVGDNAKVYGDARVYGNADVYGNAMIYGKALVFNSTKVFDNVELYGNVCVYGNAEVSGDAKVADTNDYIVFKNWWSSGRYLTWTRSNNKWKVGCFYGTGEELVAKAYKDSELSGREYKRLVDYVESILQDKKNE